jgi:two-component system alkaline phosphatase synthesis response regulator PhoP
MVLAKKEKPSLIILDMLLPKEDGISFLTRLRNDPDVGKTMVIVFSNYDVPETKAKAKELRAVDYLIKTNFTPQQIVERITFYLRK